MAEGKTYKIDKSKEAMSETPWGEIDKTELRNKIMEANNKAALVKAAYMLVLDGWENAPSEKLKYPVMCFKGDTLVYNRDGLSAALGYAKKENETEVINKVEAVYKKLGLGKEDDAKMAETTQNFEIEGRKAWAKVIKKVQDHEGNGAYVDSIEDNHIIYTKDDVRYRVEADIKVDKDDKSVDADIKWGTVKKDADQKMSKTEEEKKMSDCGCDDDCDHDDKDEEDFAQKCAEMQKQIEERDNIIMENEKKMGEMEKELSELREFKKTCMEKDKVCTVESVMNEVKDFMDEEQFKSLRDEGLSCEFSQVDAWTNKVKAVSFESVKNSTKKQNKSSNGVMWFSAPVEAHVKVKSYWK